LLALLLLATAVFAINIAVCSELNVAYSTYDLTANIVNSADIDACMNVTANNIILDCHSFTVDGLDAANTYGVLVERGASITTNITIENCPITDWQYGIWFNNTGNNTVMNSTITSDTDFDIYLLTSDNSTVTNTTVSSPNEGIYLETSSNNLIYNNTANGNGDSGYVLVISSNNNFIYSNIANGNTASGVIISDNSDSNLIYNNTANGNGDSGIVIELNSDNNSIYNNLLNQTTNFRFAGTVLLNFWNTTNQSGTRIYSAGTNIGGNYYTNATGNGHSDTCNDSDKDGFCDAPWDLVGSIECNPPSTCSNSTDYLALSNLYLAPSSGGIPDGGGSSTTGIGATASNVTQAVNLNLDQSVDLGWLSNILASVKEAVFSEYGTIPLAYVMLFICMAVIYFDIDKKGRIRTYGKVAGIIGVLVVLIYTKVI